MKRRRFLLGAAGLALLGAGVWLRPRASGAPYSDYFRALNEELKRNGPMRPCLVLDLDRLDHNIAVLRQSIRAPKHYRVVAKSLPSEKLIGYVFDKAQTDRLMAFHQPFLNAEARAFPDADILLGKPLPARSAQIFYREHRGRFDPARQLQWLIDTPQRLQQYLELAQALGTRLRINLEIDVGLHRGGVADTGALDTMLALIRAHPARLEFAGFMGYDPHVVKLPRLAGSRAELFAAVLHRYRGFVDYTREQYADLWSENVTLNGAGSPTYRLYEHDTLLNDLSVGSALVKPTDFDLDTLAAHVPALFIATPVLKTTDGLRLPELDGLSRLARGWDPNRRRGFFIYGGYWKARPESPAGLQTSGLYGRSSNQELLTGSAAIDLAPDDQVFLRPTQSEGVMLEFGDLVVLRDGKVVDHWPVLASTSP
ncbi:MAG TPA: DSD1 family PLP-dependent enzyme [Nevskiales bacterium]|nr:DSD1 family PLP-dependent enzyme [Nevskiales bacterium]